MANGLIRLHASQNTLIEQLRHFPKADHDDGPDALHMLWMAATSGAGVYAYEAVGSRSTWRGGGQAHQSGGAGNYPPNNDDDGRTSWF